MKNVGRIFNQAKQDSAGYEAYAQQLGKLFQTQPAVLEQLLEHFIFYRSCRSYYASC